MLTNRFADRPLEGVACKLRFTVALILMKDRCSHVLRCSLALLKWNLYVFTLHF